jgi:hypothetical protein
MGVEPTSRAYHPGGLPQFYRPFPPKPAVLLALVPAFTTLEFRQGTEVMHLATDLLCPTTRSVREERKVVVGVCGLAASGNGCRIQLGHGNNSSEPVLPLSRPVR